MRSSFAPVRGVTRDDVNYPAIPFLWSLDQRPVWTAEAATHRHIL